MSCEDDPVMTLSLRLRLVPCPTCGRHNLTPILRCNYYPDGCLWMARCGSCKAQYHFDLSRSTKPGWSNQLLESTGDKGPARRAT
ncbi:MAG: hypothetical protein EWM73_03737 [Nitrospira sp.]|nr:MAG: hypothetical protein EWM73_03737 [Nitrospira sp.]